jgi:hypothetical protein
LIFCDTNYKRSAHANARFSFDRVTSVAAMQDRPSIDKDQQDNCGILHGTLSQRIALCRARTEPARAAGSRIPEVSWTVSN